jgi:hypothetical protein
MYIQAVASLLFGLLVTAATKRRTPAVVRERAPLGDYKMPAPNSRLALAVPFGPDAKAIPNDDGKAKLVVIPPAPPEVILPPRAEGHWTRCAPQRDGVYRLDGPSWYCCALEWGLAAPAKFPRSEKIDPAEVARAFLLTRKWAAMSLWSHPDRLDSSNSMILPAYIPITREPAPGRIWVLGRVLNYEVATLSHDRAIEVWKRWTGDV